MTLRPCPCATCRRKHPVSKGRRFTYDVISGVAIYSEGHATFAKARKALDGHFPLARPLNRARMTIQRTEHVKCRGGFPFPACRYEALHGTTWYDEYELNNGCHEHLWEDE